MQLTQKQKKAIEELEQWFNVEIKKLKVKEIGIMKEYDKRKSDLIERNIKKIIKDK